MEQFSAESSHVQESRNEVGNINKDAVRKEENSTACIQGGPP